MPKESGLVLIERLKETEKDIPAVLITGDPSIETVDEALELGAEDYISKPFHSIDHLVRRLRSVLDRRITGLLFDVMLSDLSKAVHSGTGGSREFTDLSQTILEHKNRLGKRPACGIIDDNPARSEERRQGLYEGSVIAINVPYEEHDIVFESAAAPLVAAVSLECPDAIHTIQTLHLTHPKLEVFAFAGDSDVDTALKAVEAGATDFALLADEGMAPCARRVDRLVRRARRHLLYLELVGLLYHAACDARPDLAEDIIFAASEEDRNYILNHRPDTSGSSS
jgi:DNA-binding NtrC family response regulator